VADTGSFARAAESVNRSPSAVSMQIKAIEESLGKPLFTRTTRDVVLTQEGQTLVDYGRQMLAMREEAWASVVRPEMRGRVSIGVPDDYASSLLPSVLRKFAVAHPRVEIRVIGLPSSGLIPLLKDNTLDLACFTKARGVSGEFIRFEPMVWAAADSFDLVPDAALPLALYRERSVSREAALAALNDNDLTWEIVYTSPSLTGVRAAALAGLAITPLPASALVEGLRILDVAEGLPRLPDLEFAIYDKPRPDKAAAALAAVLLTLAQGPSRPAI